MVKLADFASQTHITAVLRAMVVKNEPSSSIVLWGGLEETRREIAQAFLQALNCHAPVKGDSCGVCLVCKETLSFSEPAWDYSEDRKHVVYCTEGLQVWVGLETYVIYSVQNLSDLGWERVNRSTVFEVKPAPCRNPVNARAEAMLVHICRHETKELLEKSAVNTLNTLVPSLIEVFQELLIVKHGLQDFTPTETVTSLASTLTVQEIITGLRLCWEASSRTTLPSPAFMAILASALKPEIFTEIYSYDSAKPIRTVDIPITEQSLSLEEMVEIAKA